MFTHTALHTHLYRLTRTQLLLSPRALILVVSLSVTPIARYVCLAAVRPLTFRRRGSFPLLLLLFFFFCYIRAVRIIMPDPKTVITHILWVKPAISPFFSFVFVSFFSFFLFLFFFFRFARFFVRPMFCQSRLPQSLHTLVAGRSDGRAEMDERRWRQTAYANATSDADSDSDSEDQ